ncbi:hypothetical protein DXC92_01555 [Clostridiales bacterium TF09-2AC]|nr:hypothetical protein DXC92_01555 [Clostridiales bacterium TF09-2AC]
MNEKQQFYNDFYKELETAMEPVGGQLHEITVPKNNSTMKGITVKFDDRPMAPTVYPDLYYGDWKEGVSVKDIVSGLKKELINTMPGISKFDIGSMNRDSAPGHLYAAVVSYDNNKGWLANVPHERMADLAVFAKWKFATSDLDSVASAKITDQLLTHLQLTKEEALKIAKHNTAQDVRFVGMNDMMAGILMDEGMDKELAEAMMGQELVPLKVLTNESGIDGAALIACPEALKSVHRQMGEDFYILPSSIHEALILPKSFTDNVDDLKQMVQSVNQSEFQ